MTGKAGQGEGHPVRAGRKLQENVAAVGAADHSPGLIGLDVARLDRHTGKAVAGHVGDGALDDAGRELLCRARTGKQDGKAEDSHEYTHVEALRELPKLTVCLDGVQAAEPTTVIQKCQLVDKSIQICIRHVSRCRGDAVASRSRDLSRWATP